LLFKITVFATMCGGKSRALLDSVNARATIDVNKDFSEH